MSAPSPELRRFVRRALVDATGVAAPDSAALATAFTALCDRLHRRLQPLFGTAAVETLFARALHLAASEFPWLVDVVAMNGAGCAVRQTPTVDSPEDGLAAVLAHDIGLLSTLIGEDIVLPLVQQAWGTVAPGETDQRDGER
jgi:hypothetical protein